MKALKDFDFRNKRVLVRCDFNVPLSKEGDILDDYRIKQTLPTIEYLIKEGAEVILMSHLGNPGGKFKKELVMAPVAQRLEKLLGKKLVLLENLRFNPGEENNDDNFAKDLAQKGDIYVNDAFSVCHREHASVVAIVKYLPSCAGFLLEKEIKILGDLLKNPRKPLIGVIGGKKVEDKSKAIDNLSKVADFILISGLIKKEINDKNIKFAYPQKIIGPQKNLEAPDIDEKTINICKDKIKKAQTVFWSGPFGRIEEKEFQKGTEEIARAIIESGAFSIVGGGETAEFINKLGLIDKFDHVSTGGGAMLAFLAGERLPGIIALE